MFWEQDCESPMIAIGEKQDTLDVLVLVLLQQYQCNTMSYHVGNIMMFCKSVEA